MVCLFLYHINMFFNVGITAAIGSILKMEQIQLPSGTMMSKRNKTRQLSQTNSDIISATKLNIYFEGGDEHYCVFQHVTCGI